MDRATGFLYLFKHKDQVLRRSLYREDYMKRKNRLSVLLNSREMKAFSLYCSRYRIKNRSEFMRTTIMKAIISKFDEEHPTLWEEPSPTLFKQ